MVTIVAKSVVSSMLNYYFYLCKEYKLLYIIFQVYCKYLYIAISTIP